MAYNPYCCLLSHHSGCATQRLPAPNWSISSVTDLRSIFPPLDKSRVSPLSSLFYALNLYVDANPFESPHGHILEIPVLSEFLSRSLPSRLPRAFFPSTGGYDGLFLSDRRKVYNGCITRILFLVAVDLPWIGQLGSNHIRRSQVECILSTNRKQIDNTSTEGQIATGNCIQLCLRVWPSSSK